MDAGIIIAVIGAGTGLAGAAFSYRASASANRVSKRKVDSEVFERSQGMYERLLSNADKELTRLQGHVDRLNNQIERTSDQLAQEKDVSNQLRAHVATLQRQVGVLEETINSLRLQFNPEQTRRSRPSLDYRSPGLAE